MGEEQAEGTPLDADAKIVGGWPEIVEHLTEHLVEGSSGAVEVHVLDGPGDGGACHQYRITVDGQPPALAVLGFQTGPIGDNGPNGITNESLLAVVAHRLRGFQKGEFACHENELALSHVEGALQALNRRTADRVKRGVEGSHQP